MQRRVPPPQDNRNSQSTPHDPHLLKNWRDQIIRSLADEGKLAKAGEYTRFIDETLVDKKKKDLEARMQDVEKFIAGLKDLDTKGQFTAPNIAKLLQGVNHGSASGTAATILDGVNPDASFARNSLLQGTIPELIAVSAAKSEVRTLNERFAGELDQWFQRSSLNKDKTPEIRAAFSDALASIELHYPDLAAGYDKFSTIDAYLYMAAFRENAAEWLSVHFPNAVKRLKESGKTYAEGVSGRNNFYYDLRRALLGEVYFSSLSKLLEQPVQMNDIRAQMIDLIASVDRNGSSASTIERLALLEKTLQDDQSQLSRIVAEISIHAERNDFEHRTFRDDIQATVPKKLLIELVKAGGISLLDETLNDSMLVKLKEVVETGRKLGAKPGNQVTGEEANEFVVVANQVIDQYFAASARVKELLHLPAQLDEKKAFYPSVLELESLLEGFVPTTARSEVRSLPEIWAIEQANGLNFQLGAENVDGPAGKQYYFSANFSSFAEAKRVNPLLAQGVVPSEGVSASLFPLGSDRQVAANFVYSLSAWGLNLAKDSQAYLTDHLQRVTERTKNGLKLQPFGETLAPYESIISERIQQKDFPFSEYNQYVKALTALKKLYNDEASLRAVMSVLDGFVLKSLKGQSFPSVFWDSAVPALAPVVRDLADLQDLGSRVIREQKWRMGAAEFAHEIKVSRQGGELQNARTLSKEALFGIFSELMPGLAGIEKEVGQTIQLEAPRVTTDSKGSLLLHAFHRVGGRVASVTVAPWSTNDYYAKVKLTLEDTYQGFFYHRHTGHQELEYDLRLDLNTGKWGVSGNGFATYRTNSNGQSFGAVADAQLIKAYIEREVFKTSRSDTLQPWLDELGALNTRAELADWTNRLLTEVEAGRQTQIGHFSVAMLEDVSDTIGFFDGLAPRERTAKSEVRSGTRLELGVSGEAAARETAEALVKYVVKYGYQMPEDLLDKIADMLEQAKDDNESVALIAAQIRKEVDLFINQRRFGTDKVDADSANLLVQSLLSLLVEGTPQGGAVVGVVLKGMSPSYVASLARKSAEALRQGRVKKFAVIGSRDLRQQYFKDGGFSAAEIRSGALGEFNDIRGVTENFVSAASDGQLAFPAIHTKTILDASGAPARGVGRNDKVSGDKVYTNDDYAILELVEAVAQMVAAASIAPNLSSTTDIGTRADELNKNLTLTLMKGGLLATDTIKQTSDVYEVVMGQLNISRTGVLNLLNLVTQYRATQVTQQAA